VDSLSIKHCQICLTAGPPVQTSHDFTAITHYFFRPASLPQKCHYSHLPLSQRCASIHTCPFSKGAPLFRPALSLETCLYSNLPFFPTCPPLSHTSNVSVSQLYLPCFTFPLKMFFLPLFIHSYNVHNLITVEHDMSNTVKSNSCTCNNNDCNYLFLRYFKFKLLSANHSVMHDQ
jgi:hypothetical protein